MARAGYGLSGDGDQDALGREIESLRREVADLRERLAEVQVLADADVLAPILNRRAFVRELDRTVAFVARYGGTASLLYFDLDGFKSVNDQFGHAAGDAALVQVAARLPATVRASDVVGRLGGDEFGVILGQSDAVAAAAKAAVLAAAICDVPVIWEAREVRLEASWGVCEVEPQSMAEQVVAAADTAMYAQKSARRS